MPNLFQLGKFTLHAGGSSDLKIDCDAFSNDDIAVLAYVISCKYKFSNVIGIPTGGLRLTEALKIHCRKDDPHTLIVDDVLTTGKSMEEMRLNVRYPSVGCVIFARGPLPDWVDAVFKTEMF